MYFAQDIEALSLFVIAMSIVGVFVAVAFLAMKLAKTVDHLGQQLGDLGPQLRGILNHVDQVVVDVGGGARERVDQAGRSLNQILQGTEKAVDSLLFTLKMVEKGLGPILVTLSGLVAGISRFVRVFRERGERKSA